MNLFAKGYVNGEINMHICGEAALPHRPEAIHNILKHAQAHNLTLQLQAQKTNTTLVITDDGIGFDMNLPKIDKEIGLQVMQYRASSINATLDIISSPGKGTTILCVF